MVEVNENDFIAGDAKDGSRKHNRSLKRIDFCGNRCYQRTEEEYYPSVTSVLNCLPVAPNFVEWLKDVGHNADIIRTRAAKEGTQVHEATEKLVAGEKIEWIDGYGNARYGLGVWQMILRFANFWNTYKPNLIASEIFVWSDKYRFAGAADLVVELEGVNWLLDVKTSNSLSKSYELQLAAYRQGLLESKGIKVDKAGILWLKAATRKPSKVAGVYQGEGWQIREVSDLDKNFEAFLSVYRIFELFNPEVKPNFKEYPTEISLI